MNEPSGRYKLYGDFRSGNCYKAAQMLHLVGKEFDWAETDILARATRTDEFLAMNPNGKVPVLQLPDGRVLSESNAMLLHLAEGTRWLPDDAYERALVYQWLFFEQYSHEPYIAVVRFIVSYAKSAGEQPERIEELRKKGYAALDVMENRLERRPFLAGDPFTIADIALYAYTHVAHEGGFEIEPFPAVRGWLDRVGEQPGMLAMREACA
jgi:glutathione S-transferase